MLRTLSLLGTTTLLSAIASAQCLVGGGTAITFAGPDDSLSAVLPMGITFPMAGAAGAPFTHCVVSTNGVVYLTTGGAPSDGSATDYGDVTDLQGIAGASPRIAPYWSDLWDAFYPGVAWSIRMDTSVQGRCAITWKDACEWGSNVPALDFQVELFDTGIVTFNYGAIDTSLFFDDALVGVSIGNNVADPGSTDLSAVPSSTTGILYQVLQPGTFDLGNTGISFLPNGSGYTVITVCSQQPASHTSYGAGCYAISDSFYQFLPDATAAATALTGQSIVMTPAGNQYLAVSGGGAFIAPTGAATPLSFVPFDDDGVTTITLPSPLPIPGGSTNTLVVHSNGNVWVGDNYPSLAVDYDPFVSEVLAAPNTGWWSWHDYNASEAGSGQIKVENVGTVTCITWDNVENYPTGTANPSTMQFQFDRATGVVTIVWPSIDANATSPYGSAHVVGYSPSGLSTDAGSITLATALPLVTPAVNTNALSLAATPAPVSTAGTGTLVTYTTDAIPEAAPSSGIYIAMTIFSLGQVPTPGLDLAVIGAPGCFAHVASFDLTLAMVGVTPMQTVQFNVPPGITAGTTIYAQSAALVAPGSLPNGQNAFGIVTSNGITTFVSSF